MGIDGFARRAHYVRHFLARVTRVDQVDDDPAYGRQRSKRRGRQLLCFGSTSKSRLPVSRAVERFQGGLARLATGEVLFPVCPRNSHDRDVN